MGLGPVWGRGEGRPWTSTDTSRDVTIPSAGTRRCPHLRHLVHEHLDIAHLADLPRHEGPVRRVLGCLRSSLTPLRLVRFPTQRKPNAVHMERQDNHARSPTNPDRGCPSHVRPTDTPRGTGPRAVKCPGPERGVKLPTTRSVPHVRHGGSMGTRGQQLGGRQGGGRALSARDHHRGSRTASATDRSLGVDQALVRGSHCMTQAVDGG